MCLAENRNELFDVRGTLGAACCSLIAAGCHGGAKRAPQVVSYGRSAKLCSLMDGGTAVLHALSACLERFQAILTRRYGGSCLHVAIFLIE